MIKETTPDLSSAARGLKLFACVILLGILALSAAPFAQAATTTSSSSEGIKCADEDYAKTLFNAGESSFSIDMAQRYGAGEDTREAFIKNPIKDGFGSVKKRYCIGQMHDFLDSLKSLLDGDLIGLIMGFIVGLLEDLLNAVCVLVVDAINTALEMICLPLPQLGLPNFTLPGLDGVSCDGISLADYVRIDYGDNFDLNGSSYMPSDLMSVPLSRIRPRSETERTYNLYDR